tara:strand:- start:354 stop:857 length:504 start_codon:yes stop_codon:yes gene_type:complete
MALDISGLNFFMPVFSFLLVFIIVYSLLAKYKVIGDNKFTLSLISLIIAIIFMSFSSLDLYIQNVVPWIVVLIIIVFFVVLLGMFSSKDWVPKSWLGWVVIGVLILIFLIAAIRVFNPVFHPDLGITSGEGTSMLEQLRGYMGGGVVGSIILVVIGVIVAWILTKKG